MDSMPPQPIGVFFDWDGTLVDSFALILAAHNHARSGLSLEPLSEGDFRLHFGQPRSRIYAALYGERAAEAQKYYESFVYQHHLEKLAAMDGARELLLMLREQNIPAGIVSNKRRDFLQAEVEAMGWGDLLAVVIGSGDTEQDKPEAQPLLAAIERSGLDGGGDDVWFVGDTDIDILCARNAGCRPVFISGDTLFNSKGLLSTQPMIVKNCNELYNLLLQCMVN